jgi:hypothetical protein
VYLRHDLDVCLEEALDMANLESELGVRATYFILVNSPLYNPLSQGSLEFVHHIQAKGHWIGLHIDLGLLSSFDISAEDDVLQLIRFGSSLPMIGDLGYNAGRGNPRGRESHGS